MTIFISVLNSPPDAKSADLRNSIASAGPQLQQVDAEKFSSIPGAPFAYWISDAIRDQFAKHPPFEDGQRIVRQGGVTGDDARYLRLRWEISSKRRKDGLTWETFAKGGNTSPWYAEYPVVVAWRQSRLTFYGFTGLLHRPSEKPSSADQYFKGGLTWPLRAANFSPSVLPKGAIFSIRGYAILAPDEDLLGILAACNSKIFDYLFKVSLGRFEFPEFVVGTLQRLPFPLIDDQAGAELAVAAEQAWKLKRALAGQNEQSIAFEMPPGLGAEGRANSIRLEPDEVAQQISLIQARVDDTCFELFGIERTARAAITGSVDGQGTEVDAPDDGMETDGDEDTADQASSSFAIFSWSVGVAFGRFDIRLATGEREIPPKPGPFDPLPAKSPGMLPEGEAPFLPSAGVFVDDPGHPDDLAARVTAVYERVDETAPAPVELRRLLAKDFFPVHIRMYSKSRRKAPVYWQLATPTASYSVWLYIHAFTKDTLFLVQNDYLAPKLRDERHHLDRLRLDGGTAPTSAQSRAIEAQSAFVEELSSMQEEVRRIALLWDPNLDDGVILNFAPLWRLVPQNRAWQKECRTAWEALVKGDYDWAHLAMRLWPERVVPKCAKDRSLAIAHDLEDAFWVEGTDGKWTARKVPTRPMDDLIAERTSPAMKAALASLLEAPEPVSALRRRGRTAG